MPRTPRQLVDDASALVAGSAGETGTLDALEYRLLRMAERLAGRTGSEAGRLRRRVRRYGLVLGGLRYQAARDARAGNQVIAATDPRRAAASRRTPHA